MKYFGDILNEFPFDSNSFIVPAVTSKSRDDDLYDSRLYISCSLASHTNPNITVQDIFSAKETILSSHHNGPRDIPTLKSNTELKSSFIYNNETIYIVDDVFTCG